MLNPRLTVPTMSPGCGCILHHLEPPSSPVWSCSHTIWDTISSSLLIFTLGIMFSLSFCLFLDVCPPLSTFCGSLGGGNFCFVQSLLRGLWVSSGFSFMCPDLVQLHIAGFTSVSVFVPPPVSLPRWCSVRARLPLALTSSMDTPFQWPHTEQNQNWFINRGKGKQRILNVWFKCRYCSQCSNINKKIHCSTTVTRETWPYPLEQRLFNI